MMKYKENDKELFDRLHDSQLGEQLVDYMERVERHLCDIRNLDDNMDVEAARAAADAISELLINKIEKRSDSKDTNALSELSRQHE